MRRSRPIGQDLRHDEPLVYERLSDPILVKRAKDGDRSALAALCERHAPRVERLAHHLLRDHEDARDASQDALAKLCVKLPQFRGESSFSTWLHRLVVNACRDVAQRQLARRCVPLEEDRREARDGDIVLIAGKGHETGQIVGDRTLPFDDVQVEAGTGQDGSTIPGDDGTIDESAPDELPYSTTSNQPHPSSSR